MGMNEHETTTTRDGAVTEIRAHKEMIVEAANPYEAARVDGVPQRGQAYAPEVPYLICTDIDVRRVPRNWLLNQPIRWRIRATFVAETKSRGEELRDGVLEQLDPEAVTARPTLKGAIEYATERLPDGWRVELQIERGSAWVELSNPQSRDVGLISEADESLEEQIISAVGYAQSIDALEDYTE